MALVLISFLELGTQQRTQSHTGVTCYKTLKCFRGEEISEMDTQDQVVSLGFESKAIITGRYVPLTSN